MARDCVTHHICDCQHERLTHAEAMLNWIEKHAVSMRSLVPGTLGIKTFEVTYYGPNGEHRYVEGTDLRDCLMSVANGSASREPVAPLNDNGSGSSGDKAP